MTVGRDGRIPDLIPVPLGLYNEVYQALMLKADKTFGHFVLYDHNIMHE